MLRLGRLPHFHACNGSGHKLSDSLPFWLQAMLDIKRQHMHTARAQKLVGLSRTSAKIKQPAPPSQPLKIVFAQPFLWMAGQLDDSTAFFTAFFAHFCQCTARNLAHSLSRLFAPLFEWFPAAVWQLLVDGADMLQTRDYF